MYAACSHPALRSYQCAVYSSTYKLHIFTDAGTKMIYGSEKVTSKINFYDLVDKKMDGEEVSMSTYKGNVLLVVNVASK